MPPRHAFQNARTFFLDHVVPICQESEEYKDLTADRLGELLVLADRVVAACDQQLDNARVVELADHLPDAIEHEEAEAVLVRIELWLKGLWWLADPEGWRTARDEGEAAAAAKRRNDFNLFGVLVRLELLTKEEADRRLEKYEEFKDPVRGLLLLAKEKRNAPVHDPKKPRAGERQLRLQAAGVALLAPVLKHFEALQTSLSRLVIAPLIDEPDVDVNNEFQRLIQSIASERRRHLEHFAGRERWLQTIREHLETKLHPSGGYLLIVAPEGTGKSALAAKASEMLAVMGTAIGPAAEPVRMIAPWLPGVLLHMGKQSSQPDEIVRLLLAQGNAMLLEPIGPPSWTDRVRESSQLAAHLPRVKSRLGADGANEDESDLLSLTESDCDSGSYYERHHRVVFQALERLRDERGRAILIVDALEEIGRDENRLGFLPPVLPPGVTALLTVRPNTPAEAWAKRTLHRVTAINLGPLQLEDIALITRVSDIDDVGREFNQQVFNRTTGVALVVRHIADEIRTCGGEFQNVSIDGSLDLLFRRQAGLWRNVRATGFSTGLDEVLLLLSVFDPVGWLSRGMIQGYLESRGVSVSSPELDDALQSVAAQLEGLREDRLRLAVRAFAQHVREKVFSDRDVMKMLRQIGGWLATDPDVIPNTVGAFLRHWGGPKRKAKFHRVAEEVLASLRDAGRYEALLTTVQSSRKPGQSLLPIAEMALRGCADAKFPPAMSCLGVWLITGKVLPQNIEQGLTWLRRAAEQGELVAMEALADYFLAETEQRDREEGLRWLRVAVAAGSIPATRVLGWRLLKGRGVPCNEAEGTRLLRVAIAAHDAQAIGLLGKHMLNHSDRAGEGWSLLRRSAEAGHQQSMLTLGDRLLDGRGIGEDRAEGEKWLRRSAEAGHQQSMLTLGDRLLDGRGLDRNPKAGEAYLRRAAEFQFVPAMAALGSRILAGTILATSPDEAERWLRSAVEANHHLAGASLGYILYSQGLRTEASKVFLAAFRSGATIAGVNLGFMLRRGQVPSELECPLLIELLALALSEKHPTAVVNSALAQAIGFQTERDWVAADRLFTEIPKEGQAEELHDVVAWWKRLADEGDPEGDLVLAWLARHQLAADPDRLTLPARMGRARHGPWVAAPEWLDRPVTPAAPAASEPDPAGQPQ